MAFPNYLFLSLFLLLNVSAFSQLALEFDINQKPAGSTPESFVEMDGKIYFAADDTKFGKELWVHDPATGSTTRLTDVREGADGSIVTESLFAYDGRVYFGANSRLHYYEEATGDVTAASPTAGARTPNRYVVIDGMIYFVSLSSGNNSRIFRYDPATNGIEVVADLNPDVNNDSVGDMFLYNDLLYLQGNDQVNGLQLWTYNPSNDELERISNIAPDVNGGGFNIMVRYEDRVFYRGEDGTDIGREFFEFNLTTKEHRLIAEIRPGSQSSDLIQLQLVEDQLVFRARPGPGGDYLSYIYDITTDELELIDFSGTGIISFNKEHIYNGKVLGAGASEDHGYELFQLDLNTKEVSLLKDINPGPESSEIYEAFVFGDDMYVSTFDTEVDIELFKLDLITKEYALLADINTTTASSEPLEFTPYDNKLYFTAESPKEGRELWVYDPVGGTTELVKDFFPGALSSNPSYMKAFDDKLFFRIRVDFGENVLAYYEASTDSIYQALEVFGGENPEEVLYIEVFKNKLYFGARDENGDEMLYCYDPSSGNIDELFATTIKRTYVLDDRLYVVNETTELGEELYYLDEVSSSLELAADINEGEDDSYPRLLTAFNGQIFFIAFESQNSFSLYSYDPISEETTYYPFNSNNINIETMAVYDDQLYFGAAEFGSDIELYRLNNATETFELVQDIVEGNSGSRPRNMVAFNDKLVFTAETDAFGRELWEYDSETDTAMIIADIWPGISTSAPQYLTLFNDKIYFAADNGSEGEEIWSLAACLNAFLTTTPDIDNNGSGTIDLSVSGGTPPYIFNWSNAATTEDIDNLDEGNYFVTITDQTGCITSLEGRIDFASGINETSLGELRIYPNPVVDHLIIEQENGGADQLAVFDVYGRNVLNRQSMGATNQLNFSALNNGIYFINFFKEDQQIGTRRIVLSRE